MIKIKAKVKLFILIASVISLLIAFSTGVIETRKKLLLEAFKTTDVAAVVNLGQSKISSVGTDIKACVNLLAYDKVIVTNMSNIPLIYSFGIDGEITHICGSRSQSETFINNAANFLYSVNVKIKIKE